MFNLLLNIFVLVLTILLIVLILRKSDLQFKLLRIIYPNRNNKIKTYFRFLCNFRYNWEYLNDYVWLTFPFYIIKRNQKINNVAKPIHNKLLKLNRYIIFDVCILLICFIVKWLIN